MKLYFDHRTCEAVSVYITVNDEYLGRVRARKERVTSIELPLDVEKIKLSFSAVFDPSDELEKVEYNSFSFGYEKEKEIAHGGLVRMGWQYPYDLEIDMTKYQEDLVFYPANLYIADSEDILFYKGRRVSNCGGVEMKLLKRQQGFKVKDYRKEKMLTEGLFLLAGCAFLFFNLFQYFVMYLPDPEAFEVIQGTHRMLSIKSHLYVSHSTYYIMHIVGCSMIASGSLGYLYHLAHYDGMIREEKMKDTYIFTERDEVKESYQ